MLDRRQNNPGADGPEVLGNCWVTTEELQQLQVQEDMDSMVKNVDGGNIWKMQGFMFWCRASYCENSQVSMKPVHRMLNVALNIECCVECCIEC
ncbi:hypothetical protein GH733_007323 [Mirounga leonina]|nr:hypothetical protein GH733_007323 [Mirounga leonina]